MKPKNVVVILADQLRKDCLGVYGNGYVKTPNIDRLAGQSVRFNRSYVANPICSPNRLSMFSGLYPSNHGLNTNGLLKSDDGRTLMHLLQNQGYQTASIGKIHFNPFSAESAGKSFESEACWREIPDTDAYREGYFGFDYIELSLGHTLPCAHYYKWFKGNGGTNDMFNVETYGPSYSPDEQCGVRRMPSRLSASAFVGERSVNYIRTVRDRKRPFFLSVSFPDPHHPFTSCYDDYERWASREVKPGIGSADDLRTRPEHFSLLFNGGWSRKGKSPFKFPGGIPEDIGIERKRHTYAMIEAVDHNIGIVLDELERQGLMEDTIIIFTSDHGELLGDHGLWLKGPFLYEGLVNTPLTIYVPNNNAYISDGLFSTVDIAPTVLDLLDMPIPSDMDGISQAAELRGGGEKIRETCLIEYRNGYNCDVNVNAIVGNSYKYVIYESGEEEYTDLKSDPQETKNVVNEPSYQYEVSQARRALIIDKLRAKSKANVQYGHA